MLAYLRSVLKFDLGALQIGGKEIGWFSLYEVVLSYCGWHHVKFCKAWDRVAVLLGISVRQSSLSRLSEAYERTLLPLELADVWGVPLPALIEATRSVEERQSRSGSSASDLNDDLCLACGQGGELVLCDTCPRSFHPDCLSALFQNFEDDSVDWNCPLCSGDWVGMEPSPLDADSSSGKEGEEDEEAIESEREGNDSRKAVVYIKPSENENENENENDIAEDGDAAMQLEEKREGKRRASDSGHMASGTSSKKTKTVVAGSSDSELVCFTCRYAGEVIACNHCTRYFHPFCLEPEMNLSNVNLSTWKCPVCSPPAGEDGMTWRHHDYCFKCREGGELLECESCPRTYHLSCTTPALEEVPEGAWICDVCRGEAAAQSREDEILLFLTFPHRRIMKYLSADERSRWNVFHGLQAAKGKRAAQIVTDSSSSGKDEGSGDDSSEDSLSESDGKEDNCRVCGEDGELLICEGCPAVYHMSCLTPPLSKLPRGDWYCPDCARRRGTKIRILTHRIHPDGRMEFFVTYQGRSHLHDEWISHDIVKDLVHKSALSSWMKIPKDKWFVPADKAEDDVVDPLWLVPERIIAYNQENTTYFVKWQALEYAEATWESAAFLEEKVENWSSIVETWTALDLHWKSFDGAKLKRTSRVTRFEKSPDFLPKELFEHQLIGINWLYHSWIAGDSVILGDEMGLGKTIQALAFLRALQVEQQKRGPFLVVAPLSTLRNWENEAIIWTPEMRYVTFMGSEKSRDIIMQNAIIRPEFKPLNEHWDDGRFGKFQARMAANQSSLDPNPFAFDVLITSFEIILREKRFFEGIKWSVLVVDEAHRLKNTASQISMTMDTCKSDFRLLMTGTPLQNSIRELLVLLQFVFPEMDANSVADEFEALEEGEKVEKLKEIREILKHRLLRREKKDVFKSMPVKEELIVRVDFTAEQKFLYKNILTRNLVALQKASTGAKTLKVNLNNILMQLRKVCNHCFLSDAFTEEYNHEDAESLVKYSGKFQFLDKLLPALQAAGHRVLFFSQFTSLLDIFEDYVNVRDYKYLRLDGNDSSLTRQRNIDAFNQKDSETFIFLLSTKAGGLGINLATADTVILFDSDWNPQNDLQALARAHRIGQTKKVLIYRIVSRFSVEEKILQKAKSKLALERVMVRPNRQGTADATTGVSESLPNELSGTEIERLLRFGSEELFKKESTMASIVWDDASIGQLLEGFHTNETSLAVEATEQEQSDAQSFLASFKVAAFSTIAAAEEETATNALDNAAADPGNSDMPAAVYWNALLAPEEAESALVHEAFNKLGRGHRLRKNINYRASGDSDDDEKKRQRRGKEQVARQKSSQPLSGGIVLTATLITDEIRSRAWKSLVIAERFQILLYISRFGIAESFYQAPPSVFLTMTSLEVKELLKSLLSYFRSHPDEPICTGTYHIGSYATFNRDLLHVIVLMHEVRKYVKEGQLSLSTSFPYVPWTNASGTNLDFLILQGLAQSGYGDWSVVVEQTGELQVKAGPQISDNDWNLLSPDTKDQLMKDAHETSVREGVKVVRSRFSVLFVRMMQELYIRHEGLLLLS
jgi:chromodomain-helicase-DNA-binding protein 4